MLVIMRAAKNWWNSKVHKFFGKFYNEGDDTLEGYDPNNKMDRIQRTYREIELIEKYLDLAKGSKILDCPCGSGRHSILLAKMGMEVTAVDLNPEMIAEHAEMVKTFGNYLPDFQIMDMRELQLPDNYFDFVLNMFTSFGFFYEDEENEKVVKEFYRVLKPGGKLFLTLDYNYDRVIAERYIGEENLFRHCCSGKINEPKEFYDKIEKRLYGSWTLTNGDKEVEYYSLRIYDNQKEFIPLFKSAGFSEVSLIDPSNPTFDINSKETILIATK